MHIKNKESTFNLTGPHLERFSSTVQQLAYRVTFASLEVHNSTFVHRVFTVCPQIPIPL